MKGYLKELCALEKRIEILEKQIKTVGGGASISVTANQPFPESWHTSGNLRDLITDINNDSTATKGKIYLSTVSFNDLPAGMFQAELKVEILDDSGKIILFTITSENVAPYHWEATSAYGRDAAWRSFVVNYV